MPSGDVEAQVNTPTVIAEATNTVEEENVAEGSGLGVATSGDDITQEVAEANEIVEADQDLAFLSEIYFLGLSQAIIESRLVRFS